MNRLSNNTDIIIKPVDKGRVTVTMNTKNYVTEAKRQLDNEVYYKRVERDFTPEHERPINQCVGTLIDDGELEEEVAKLLRNSQELLYSICYPKYTKLTIQVDQ